MSTDVDTRDERKECCEWHPFYGCVGRGQHFEVTSRKTSFESKMNGDKRYYEDFSLGETHEFGGRTVNKEEITEFAKKYDPLHFHLDDGTSEDSVFDGLVASGLQTIAITHRLTVDNFLRDTAVMGGPGIEEAYMDRPVYPGDTLWVRIEVEQKRLLDSDPTRGFVHIRQTAFNQDDQQVLSMVILSYIKRRETDEVTESDVPDEDETPTGRS
jgi:acyl dehydratase